HRDATASFGKQIADALATTDQFDRLQHRVAASKGQPLLVDKTAVDQFHRQRSGAPGAYRVDPHLVTALRRAQHRAALANATERAEREKAFVLAASARLIQFVQLLAADRAGGAARAHAWMLDAKLRRREARRLIKSAALEISRRQCTKAIQGQQIRRCAQFAIL